MGWVDQEGDVKVSSYDHASGERVTAVLQARLNQDDHANPSLQVRPDGRLVVFYSRHVGPSMHYRVSSQPEDVTSWDPPQTVPTNSPGIRGYTYPNPIRLEAEDATYLFWRGGNYNPTFSVQQDGETTWSAARTLITMPGQRPYVKYDSSGGDTIHVAYTNAHPAEFGDVNIYYARIRGGTIEHADGQDIGPLDVPISPGAGDVVFDQPEDAWVHDVAADSAGNPVIVFASFPSSQRPPLPVRALERDGVGGAPDHAGRRHVPRGRRLAALLRRADPRPRGPVARVPLAPGGRGAWQVETWTTANGGATWTSQAQTTSGKNVRPVSPRGMSATGGDMSVIWMKGGYPSYVAYDTSIQAFMAAATNAPPIAEAEPAVRSGPAPLEVTFETTGSRDPDGSIASYHVGLRRRHDRNGGRADAHLRLGGPLLPNAHRHRRRRRVQHARGRRYSSTCRQRPPSTRAARADRPCTGPWAPRTRPRTGPSSTGRRRSTAPLRPPSRCPGDAALHQVSATLPGLQVGRLYHYRLVADNATGSSSGEDRVFVAGSSPSSDGYRDALLATSRPGRLLADGRALRGELERRDARRRQAPSRGATCSASRACSAR